MGLSVFQWGSNPHNSPANFYPVWETIQDRAIVVVELYVLCRTVTFLMTFSDVWRSFQWHTYCYFVCAADARSVSDSWVSCLLLNMRRVFCGILQFTWYCLVWFLFSLHERCYKSALEVIGASVDRTAFIIHGYMKSLHRRRTALMEACTNSVFL